MNIEKLSQILQVKHALDAKKEELKRLQDAIAKNELPRVAGIEVSFSTPAFRGVLTQKINDIQSEVDSLQTQFDNQ